MFVWLLSRLTNWPLSWPNNQAFLKAYIWLFHFGALILASAQQTAQKSPLNLFHNNGLFRLDYVNGDTILNDFLEELKNREECRMLFSLTKGATKEDVMRAVAIIEALRREEEGR